MRQPYKKSSLVIPEAASREDLVTILDELAEQGAVSAEVVNAKLQSLSAKTHQKALKASKVDELEVDEKNTKVLSPEQKEKLLLSLEKRFLNNKHRHQGLKWVQVETRLQEASPEKLWSLNEMERTGGEPDVVEFKKKTGQLKFEDRSAESPVGRRNCVYDHASEVDFVKNYPDEEYNGNAVDMAKAMGIKILDEKEYKAAQKVDKLDVNSSSWINTPVNFKEDGFANYGTHGDYGIGQNNSYNAHPTWAFRGSLWI